MTPDATRGPEQLFELLLAAGVETWQIGINVAMGRAGGHPEALLQQLRYLAWSSKAKN